MVEVVFLKILPNKNLLFKLEFSSIKKKQVSYNSLFSGFSILKNCLVFRNSKNRKFQQNLVRLVFLFLKIRGI